MKNVIEATKILLNGFKEGLKGCGFLFSNKCCSSKLYKWTAVEEGDICEDCQERCVWPAMEMADWLKEGLPEPPLLRPVCEGCCRCKLIKK